MPQLVHTSNQVIFSTKHNKKIVWDATWVNDGIKKPVIIFIHGFKGFKDWGTFGLISNYIAKKGFVMIKLNLSHNGTTLEKPQEISDFEAFGNNNLSIELDDIGELLEQLSNGPDIIPEKNINRKKIILLGHSRGGSLAILKAAEDKRVKILITLSAVEDYLKRYSEETVERWQKEGVIKIPNTRTGDEYPLYYQMYEDMLNHNSRLNIKENARKIKIPWLVIHGNNDKTVPYNHGLHLSATNPETELYLVEGADHTYGGYHPYPEKELPSHTLQFLQKTIDFINLRIPFF